jgi:hypothetical protein
MRRSSPFVRASRLTLAVAALLCSLSADVRAHAPVPRRVAVSRDGASIALALPGFGMLFRAQADAPFVYACDALLGLPASDVPPAFSFVSDGSLLVAGAAGVQLVAPNGCPRQDVTSELTQASLVTLGASRGTPDVAYAVVSGDKAGVWRTTDGGRRWEKRSNLTAAELTSALVVAAADPNTLYLSQSAPSGATVLASTDGAASWQTFTQAEELTLLSAAGPASFPLWAVARDAAAVGNRGFAILRAEGPAGPWQWTLRVNYFGGLVVDEHDVVWAADELSGIHRSDDAGETFILAAEAAVACLAHARDALWACTPTTLEEPALQKLTEGVLTEAVALDQVDELAQCPEREVADVCGAAWAEWQRDVLLRPSPPAGELTPDAGTTHPEGADAREHDTEGEQNAGTTGDGSPQAKQDADCSLTTASASSNGVLLVLAAWGGLLARRKTRSRGRSGLTAADRFAERPACERPLSLPTDPVTGAGWQPGGRRAYDAHGVETLEEACEPRASLAALVVAVECGVH